LLIGAGLLVRSLVQVLNVERGFQTEQRLLATVSIPGAYADARRAQIVTDILARLETMPEVVSVALVSGRPLSRGSTGLGIVAADHQDIPEASVPWATWRVVTKDYFRAMGLPVIAGRGFTEQDEIGKPWRAIISQRLAEQLWRGENPVGKTAILWKGQGNRQAEVIGIVGNMRERGLENDPTLAVYFPAYGALDATTLQLVMHTKGRPEAVVPALRAAVSSIDSNLPVSGIRTLEEIVTTSVGTRRFTMLLLAVFAGLALVLAVAGVYGVLAYSVARRTAEIGVRLALGAQRRQVLGRVFAYGMRPVLVGMVIGLAATLWLSQFMASLLFGIQQVDLLTYVAASVTLTSTAALACYVPARRVLGVDPVAALRTE
jgi:putative ABC transport system permease protein